MIIAQYLPKILHNLIKFLKRYQTFSTIKMMKKFNYIA